MEWIVWTLFNLATGQTILGTEVVLVTLVDDLPQGLDRGSMSLLDLLDLSMVINMIDHIITIASITTMMPMPGLST